MSAFDSNSEEMAFLSASIETRAELSDMFAGEKWVANELGAPEELRRSNIARGMAWTLFRENGALVELVEEGKDRRGDDVMTRYTFDEAGVHKSGVNLRGYQERTREIIEQLHTESGGDMTSDTIAELFAQIDDFAIPAMQLEDQLSKEAVPPKEQAQLIERVRKSYPSIF